MDFYSYFSLIPIGGLLTPRVITLLPKRSVYRSTKEYDTSKTGYDDEVHQ